MSNLAPIVRADLAAPFFAAADGLPGLDFNRELIEPGTNDAYPEGAVGIRVDDDFWAVAALPLAYRDTPLPELVATLWPHYAEQAEYCPDSGSPEQKVYFYKCRAENAERMDRRLNKRIHELTDEIARMRKERPGLCERPTSKHMASNNYFIRQYEHLLVAMAHETVPCSRDGQGGAMLGLWSAEQRPGPHEALDREAGPGDRPALQDRHRFSRRGLAPPSPHDTTERLSRSGMT